jgi:peroxiredoxin Q/BCP
LAAEGVTVLGVSPDSVKSHKKFTEKHQLNFPLVADIDHAIAEAYGTWVEKSMYGRKYMGMERSTFVIDADGIVRRAFRKVSIPGHIEEVIAAVERL